MEVTTHTMQLKDVHYQEIVRGTKRYEARLYDEKRRSLNLLDVIEFSNTDTDDKVRATITELSHFATFRDGLSAKDFVFVVPGANTMDEAVNIYKKIYGNKEEINGVIFIKLQLIK